MAVQVRGATTHYDAVVSAATNGVLNAGLNTGVPVVFGVLTTENMEQVNANAVRGPCWLSSSHRESLLTYMNPKYKPAFPAVSLSMTLQTSTLLGGHCTAGMLEPASQLGCSIEEFTDVLAAPQALDRAGGKAGNKGFECAVTAIEMADLMRQLKSAGKAA